ncbi:MAG: carboxy-terminal-processing protease, carboxyl-terminal processing protease [Candidatus Parcubacteria bacterium]
MNLQDRKILIFLIFLPSVIVAYFLGSYFGVGKMPSPNSSLVDTTALSKDQFDAYWKAWHILDEKFVTAGSTTPQTRVWGSIQGLASSYDDPYTVFFPPVESKNFAEDIAGNFTGVGMEIGIKDKQLQVIAPIKNSPAERAGVKTGDLILKIGDKSTQDMPVDEAVKLIRGEKGTVVKILFLVKEATKPVERAIIRDVIDIPTLETGSKPGGIFTIRLFSFTAQSSNLFRNALREFVLSGNKKLILDLRGNPGGYLDAAWDMASWFLPVGTVVVTEDFGKNGEPNIYRSKGYNIFSKDLKMLILVDGGSASASEILSGALQEQGVAKLVGAKTFGKGSVQQLIPITSDTSLKVTIARWLTPKGHNLSHDGLEPDYKVEISDKDAEAKIDVQMEKAVELLNK